MRQLTQDQTDWAFSEDTIREFSRVNGAYEVHLTWKNTKLKQGRDIPDHQRKFSELPEQDVELDREVAFNVISDYIVYIRTHDKDGNHI